MHILNAHSVVILSIHIYYSRHSRSRKFSEGSNLLCKHFFFVFFVECWLGQFVFCQGIWASMLKNIISFVIFQGWGCCPYPPPWICICFHHWGACYTNINVWAQWLSGRVQGRGFEPHLSHCVVVLEQDTFILVITGSTQEDLSLNNWKIVNGK